MAAEGVGVSVRKNFSYVLAALVVMWGGISFAFTVSGYAKGYYEDFNSKYAAHDWENAAEAGDHLLKISNLRETYLNGYKAMVTGSPVGFVAGIIVGPIVLFSELCNEFQRPDDEPIDNPMYSILDSFVKKQSQSDLFYRIADASMKAEENDTAKEALKLHVSYEELFRSSVRKSNGRIYLFNKYQDATFDLSRLYAEDKELEESFAIAELGKAKTLCERMLEGEIGKSQWKSIRATNFEVGNRGGKLSQRKLTRSDVRAIADGLKGTPEGLSWKTEFLNTTVKPLRFNLNDISDKYADTTFLSYYSDRDSIIVYVIRKNKVVNCRIVRVGREKVRQDVEKLLLSLKFNDMEDVRKNGKALYDYLVKPVAASLAGERMVISPHGVLHDLPFAALFDGKEFLVEKRPLVMTPSLTFFTILDRSDSRPWSLRGANIMLLANPTSKNMVEETRYAELVLSSCSRVTKVAPRLSSFAAHYGNSDIVHIAAHSAFNQKSPDDSSILLNQSESSGREVILARDIYALDETPKSLVVLSSCSSGKSLTLPGDDPFGLGRAFFYTGAKRLISTYWDVNDVRTLEFVKEFYDKLARSGQTPSQALHVVQVSRLKSGDLNSLAFKIEGLP